MGANKIKCVRALCESGARVDALTHAGFSVLMAACANEDSDPMVVKEILSRMDRRSVNYRMRSQSTKWKVLRGCAKLDGSLSFSKICAGSSSSTRSWLDCIALRREKR